MNLFTKVEMPSAPCQLDYNSRLAFVGSCFAENISKKFVKRKFRTMVNPLGIIYNPISIENMVKRIAGDENCTGEKRFYTYNEQDVFFDGEKWNCWDAHSSLSVIGTANGEGRDQCIERLNTALCNARSILCHTDVIFITLGSAYVYFLKETGNIVSNCHRQNPSLFKRELISVDRALEALKSIVKNLQKINPRIQIVFTVSPLRHLGDGAHGNNVSKATLLLAIEKLQQETCIEKSNVSYFPSYEIVMDELRDYRFYNEDMVHLSAIAEDYIFERMVDSYCSSKTKEDIKSVEKFMKMVSHRVTNDKTEKTKDFAQKGLKDAENLENSIPGLILESEKEYFKHFL